MLKEKAMSPRSHPASWHIYTHVYFVHIYEYIHAEIQSSGPPGILSQPLGPHPSTRCAVCACVCVYPHHRKNTLFGDPTSDKKKIVV